MNTNRAALLALVGCMLLVSAPFSSAGETDWDRWMSTGDAAMINKQYSQAEASYRKALAFAESHLKKDARISTTLVKLAESCNAQGKRDEAEARANRALVALSETLRAHKPKDASEEYEQTDVSAAITDKAADIFAANQKYQDAEGLYVKVIAIREQYADETPPAKLSNEDFFRFMAQNLGNAPAKVADAVDKLAQLYRREGKYDKAVLQYQKSQAIREKQFGPDKPLVAQSLSDIAMCYALQERFDQAEPFYKHVIAILERNNLQERPEMAVALENYSLVLKKIGRNAEARTASDRAQGIRSKLSAEAH